MCVFNTEVIAFPGATSPPIPLWLAYIAWNLFCDPRVDVLGRRGAFFSHDFGLSRTGSSSAVHSGSLDSLHSSPGTSSFSAWALGLRWNGLKPLGPSGPTITPQNHAPSSSDREENFDILGPKSWPVESCFPMGARVSSATHGTLLTFWRTRCIVINAFF